MKSPSLRASFTIDNRHLSVCELSNGNGMPRDATICTNGRRETTSTGSSRVFTVRPGCRSPLSSIWSLFLAVLNLNGKEERGTLKIPPPPPVTRRSSRRYSPENLQSRAVHPLLSGLRTSRNSRRASLWSWILSIVTSSDFSAAGSTQTSTASRLSQSKDREALGQTIQTRIHDLSLAREI